MIVTFCSESNATKILPNDSMAMISITNPGDIAKLQSGWGKLLRVSFIDTEYDENTIKYFGKSWFVSSQGCIAKKHALEIRRFVDNLDASIRSLTIHCHAGASRSAAVALFCANSFGVTINANTSKHNTTVLRLLKNPNAFDAYLPSQKKQSMITNMCNKTLKLLKLS